MPIRIHRLLVPALALAAACAPAESAAQPGATAGITIIPRTPGWEPVNLVYSPVDVPVAWTRDGIVVMHGERYRESDDVRVSCAGSGIYAVPADGGAARPLSAGPPLCDVLQNGIAVTPDGARAVFSRSESRALRLAQLDLATGRVDTLPTGCDGSLQLPAVSPDGSRIAAIGRCTPEDRDNGVYVMDADGRNLRLAVPGPVEMALPAWSPDGRWIAAVLDGRVSVAPADGGEIRALGPGADPSWSPDGAWLAFADSIPGEERTWGVFVVRADGSGRRLVFRNTGQGTWSDGWRERREGEPSGPTLWSPDGRWIAFARVFGAGVSVWRVQVATGHAEPVTAPAS